MMANGYPRNKHKKDMTVSEQKWHIKGEMRESQDNGSQAESLMSPQPKHRPA